MGLKLRRKPTYSGWRYGGEVSVSEGSVTTVGALPRLSAVECVQSGRLKSPEVYSRRLSPFRSHGPSSTRGRATVELQRHVRKRTSPCGPVALDPKEFA